MIGRGRSGSGKGCGSGVNGMDGREADPGALNGRRKPRDSYPAAFPAQSTLHPCRNRSNGRRGTSLLATALAVLVVSTGCAPKQPAAGAPAGKAARTTDRTRPAPSPPRVGSGGVDDPASPCATRLHDLGGLLLHYYALNRKLPATLDEVAPLADMGVEFHNDCPDSRRPYTYAPGGLRTSGGGGMLVLYDAVPAHRGLRWGVFLFPPASGQVPTTRVILMSDEVFRGYAPTGH